MRSSMAMSTTPRAEKVAITGATGLVGRRLVRALIGKGVGVNVLTRDKLNARTQLGNLSLPPSSPSPQLEYFERNGSSMASSSSRSESDGWLAGIAGAEAVVNLAGEPISTRWSDAVKQEIGDSRIGTTKHVADLIRRCPETSRPKVLISSSAIGYYGTDAKKSFTEDDAPGSDFLARICEDWEACALDSKCERVCLLRTGLVLDKSGGVLSKMLPAVQFFVGGILGEGNQFMSWIHHRDLVGIILSALEDGRYSGAVNATAPNPVTMRAFMDTMGHVLNRPVWLPVPGFALQIALGEGAKLVLEGQKVLPMRAASLGYKYKYPTLNEALTEILV
mmetsp:Transcript_15473/g.39422  ORF Transcript_15473/g.39422 Transcript_15473/m.39422 type:complete len:335 (-) Transcript_15473:357-1361(-)|eukprot:CAMPEP_0198236146 /NCGR_PEP_ID=MMETSP1446-20131203/2041_1 /TAXON_ID=1461542 ORGANISM="Unidentified sp, Strain CCMP2111" /NCGR_SAMPLE_ID=MMETSP1446 /ASSEMBLY_ACC=CAM_ASM_001112 /LENGTH=334 /DNA_ID=CAMNT_0043917731 /DNA_START=146 /DNA_END=1150 /DNA_ORIENTATION=+